VDLSFVSRSNGTTEAFIFVEPSGIRDILISPSEEPIPLHLEVFSNTNWDHIHFTSLPLRKHVDIQARIAALAPQTAGRSLDIGALYANMGRRRLQKLLRLVNMLFATEQELEIFTGVASDNAPALLFDEGVKIVCCKRGAAGARLYRKDGSVLNCVAPAVQSVDTTGAGDVFAAVFVAASLRGATDIVALQVATNLASKSVTGYGRGAYPCVEDFVDALKLFGT
jgi:sugar/nucleoside kinase (ribokinase family)